MSRITGMSGVAQISILVTLIALVLGNDVFESWTHSESVNGISDQKTVKISEIAEPPGIPNYTPQYSHDRTNNYDESGDQPGVVGSDTEELAYRRGDPTPPVTRSYANRAGVSERDDYWLN